MGHVSQSEEEKENSEEVHASVYAGCTGRKLQEEDLRWLTQCGTLGRNTVKNHGEGKKNKARNRPVLVKADGSTIKMKEARNDYGFKSIIVYTDQMRYNVGRIEDAIQRRYDHLPLGKKLWRSVAKGWPLKDEHTKVSRKRLFNVFLAFSFNLDYVMKTQEEIDSDPDLENFWIKVNR